MKLPMFLASISLLPTFTHDNSNSPNEMVVSGIAHNVVSLCVSVVPVLGSPSKIPFTLFQ
jgi:hypothetical protein